MRDPLDVQPHAPRCHQCGREKRRNDLSAWCPMCERRLAREARRTALAWAAAVARHDELTAPMLLRSIVRMTRID
jgi:predicted amidophosphoribosyltransferase